MTSAKASLSARVQQASDLTEVQQRIAACLLSHPDEAALWGIGDLAKEARTCVASVVRFAKKLGYSGYLEMRKGLVRNARNQCRRGDQLLDAPAQAAQTLVEVVRRDIANLEWVARHIDESRLRRAVDMVKQSRHRLAIGDGVSALMTRQLSYLLVTTGLAVMEGSPADFATQVGLLGPQDLLIAVSLPPYTRETLDAVSYARKRGIPTLVFTDGLQSPAVKHADLVLPIPGENLLFSHSLATFGSIAHALATTIAREHAEDALEHLHEVEQVARPKFTRL